MNAMHADPWIHFDFIGIDSDDRAILDSFWARADIAKQIQQMQDGASVTMYEIDRDADHQASLLLASGILEFDKTRNRWTARYDRQLVRRERDMKIWPSLLGDWEDRG